MSSEQHRPLAGGNVWLAHWMVLGAACNLAGWTLSACHQLHWVGLILAIPAFWFVIAKTADLPRPPANPGALAVRLRKNLRQPLALGFMLLAVMSLVGGLLYAPNNFDALIYRLPRVLHWLMAGQWEWMRTNKNLLNTRGTGFEWWSAPFIAWLRSDRLIFGINWISFLFLPGLFYSLFRNLGVRSKVAKPWMWLMPTGYCYVLQAASIGNDLPTTLFAMAAFDFGFRWLRGGGYTCFALSVIACGMMTAMKGTTLPLLLPYTVLFFGMSRQLLARPVRTAVLAVCVAVASFLPTAGINFRHGDWSGAKIEGMLQVQPLIGVTTNSINIVLQNAVPPVFPIANTWNAKFLSLFPRSYIAANERGFEPGGAHFIVPDFQGEEFAGAGMGVTLLLVASVLLGLAVKSRKSTPQLSRPPLNENGLWLAALFGVALLAYFSKAGLSTVGRLSAAYYPFFFALALRGGKQQQVVRQTPWKSLAIATVILAIGLVFIIPSRPLWPAQTLLANVGPQSSKILQRAKNGYDVYTRRADGLGPVREVLPADATVIGYLNYATSPELPLWKPYLQRRLRHLVPGETLDTLRAEGIRYLVLNTENLSMMLHTEPAEWISAGGGEVISRQQLELLAGSPLSEWWVVKVPPRIP